MFDMIGPLVIPAEYDGDNALTHAEIVLPGWHVNTTPETMEARLDLVPFIVSPSPFRRVWAGDDPASPAVTVALRFADEAEARAALMA